MNLTVRISCATMSEKGIDHGVNAIELASALRQCASRIEKAADAFAPGHQVILLDRNDEHMIGQAFYDVVGR